MVTVLIAEDSAVIQRMLAGVLEKDKSIQIVATVSNGIDAVAKTKELKPDIVLMDYRMPNSNAPDCIKKIMSEFPTPILVVSSAEPVEERRKEVMELGALGFMEKPKSMDYNSVAIKLITQVKTLSRIKPSKRTY